MNIYIYICVCSVTELARSSAFSAVMAATHTNRLHATARFKKNTKIDYGEKRNCTWTQRLRLLVLLSWKKKWVNHSFIDLFLFFIFISQPPIIFSLHIAAAS